MTSVPHPRRTALLLGLGLLLHPLHMGGVQAAEPTLANAKVIPRVLKLIEQNYVDMGLVEPRGMLDEALDSIERTVPEILALNPDDQTLTLTIDQASRKFTIPKLPKLKHLWGFLQDLFLFIDTHYAGEKSDQDLEYAAIDGVLQALDPHSNHLRKRAYREFKVGTQGEFGGLGIVIGIRDGFLTIITEIESTPAHRAGLVSKDRIMQIGEESTINMSLTEAVERLRGRVGTSVVLTIERSNRPPFTVALKRAIIHIDSVQSTTFGDTQHLYGYIRVKSFQENTMRDFRAHLKALHSQAGGRIHGLVLDLRNNPGGLLKQAIEMGDLFLRKGVIVSTVGARGRHLEENHATSHGTEPAYPMITLVNSGSASASEIVSSALQAHGRALIVGSTTFGKGSVQTIYNLRDGSALKLTIAQYRPAGNVFIQGKGVIPDIDLLELGVDKEAMNLVPDKRYSESDLDRHLKKRTSPTEERSRYQLRFLRPTDTKKDEDEQSRKEYTKVLDLEGDYVANFARRLMMTPQPPQAPHWKDVGLTLAAVQAEEDATLDRALAKFGIDWSRGRAKGKPKLRLTTSLLVGGKPVRHIPVGVEATLLVTARNIGSGPYYQLVGQTSADIGVLRNTECVFGHLSAGASRSWKIPFTVGEHRYTEHVPITFHFQEGRGVTPADVKKIVPLKGRARPQFAYAFDFGKKFQRRTSLPMGTSIPIRVQVKNIGPGTSGEALITIKNVDAKEHAPFIEVGRLKLGEIAPGKTKSGTLRLHLDPAFPDAEFKMELAIIDTKVLESVSDTLTFHVATASIAPPKSTWYRGPLITVAHPWVSNKTRNTSQRLTGIISDDEQVKDVFIFVGNAKVFYQSNPQPSKTLKIATDIPLEPGSNLITIAARDNNNLMTQHTITVFQSDK